LQGAEQERHLLQSKVQELETMSPEEYRARQEQRRKRIEKWRAQILDFDFNESKFAYSDTYSDMRPHLQANVRAMLESQLGELHKFAVAVRTPSRAGDRRILLDEVARIEKEWGVI
jgi:hypothetical protein